MDPMTPSLRTGELLFFRDAYGWDPFFTNMEGTGYMMLHLLKMSLQNRLV